MAEDAVDPATELNELREKFANLEKEQEAWIEERERLQEEVETLKNRCQKLMRQTAKAEVKDGEAQTEADDSAGDGAEACSLLPPVVEEMLRKPKDEEVQFRCVQALFDTQTTQADSSALTTSSSALRGSLEAAVAIFGNHPANRQLCLKACQFLSVLLAEPNAEEHLPLVVLFKAAQDVVAIGGQFLADVANGGTLEAGTTPSPSKLLTWFFSLLALLLPCLTPRLKDRTQGEAFVNDLLSKLAGRLLQSAELPQEALILKCVQLLPLLPMEPWIQKACLESGTIHGLALAYRRCATGAAPGFAPPTRVGDAADAPLPKAVRAAVRWAFTQNLEICVRAMEDTFVDDAFICLEVLEELKGAEKKQRGTFLALDSDHGIIGKALGLWTHHQRRALEDPDPPKCTSREVLLKVSELLRAVLLKLPPQRLLQGMQEFEEAEFLQRIGLATINGSAQLRLQLAVNYLDNDVIKVVIGCMQMLLHHYEVDVDPIDPTSAKSEAAFKLLQDDMLPAEGWPYVNICLDVCLHILSHWSATKASLQQKAEVLDKRAAPLCLAHAGLVDVLVELVDPAAAGFELSTKPPQKVVDKASETLKALFEQNGHICLFCMQHYTEVRQMVELGCMSLMTEPLVEFPQLQQQAVTQLAASFEKFADKDEKLGRKIRKALAVLFESSYRLVAWFLEQNPLSNLAELQSLDVHAEAVQAVARAPYWSSEDAHMLPEFVALISQLLMGSIEGADPDAPASASGKRVLDLTEAEEVVAGCIAAVLHLLLIDPSPPTVLECLATNLTELNSKGDQPAPDQDTGGGSEQAVNAVMRVMQVFPSSDRVQTNCHLLLTSLLGE